jgi:hypothetical protein
VGLLRFSANVIDIELVRDSWIEAGKVAFNSSKGFFQAFPDSRLEHFVQRISSLSKSSSPRSLVLLRFHLVHRTTLHH